MNPPQRKAQRTNGQAPSKEPGNSVRLEPAAARLLKAQVKKLGLKEIQFASAAITYFAEAGLDPTAERPQGLHDLSVQLREEARAARALNASLLSFLQRQEKNLYAFLEQQQGGTLNYLEQIESTLLRHHLEVESNLISPMVESIWMGTVEANITRRLVTRLYTEDPKERDLDKKAAEPYQKQTTQMNNERKQMVERRVRIFHDSHRVPKPDPTPKPWVLIAPPPTPIDAPDTPVMRDAAPR